MGEDSGEVPLLTAADGPDVPSGPKAVGPPGWDGLLQGPCASTRSRLPPAPAAPGPHPPPYSTSTADIGHAFPGDGEPRGFIPQMASNLRIGTTGPAFCRVPPPRLRRSALGTTGVRQPLRTNCTCQCTDTPKHPYQDNSNSSLAEASNKPCYCHRPHHHCLQRPKG